MEFFRIRKDIPFMRHALVFNVISLITFLLAVNVILLLAGNFMEPSSIVLIFAPILFPVAVALGIHPVHFGILMVVNMEVGMCHPPVGLNLYVASGITKMLIAVLVYAVYSNLITVVQAWVVNGKLPFAVGLWLPHVFMLVPMLILFRQRSALGRKRWFS